MKAAIYCRYSSDLQRPASIEDQLRQCRDELARRGWAEAHVFTDSEVAGTVAERRPGYQALLDAARGGQFEVIVADELSRLARRGAESFALYDRLRFWRVGLVCLLEGLDSLVSPEAARAIMAIKSYTNEVEGDANAHRSRRGLAGRVLAGMHAGGMIYGYRTRAVTSDRPGDPEGTGHVLGYEYLIHEEEAAVIRRVFTLYAEGMSARRIAALLNAEGVPPPGARWRNRRTRAARTWSGSAIAGDRHRGFGLLNNERYIGRLNWNRSTWPRDPERDGKQVRRELPPSEWVRHEVPELRVVPQELWDAVKARQEERAAATCQHAGYLRKPRLLSGLLTCSKCGQRMVLRGSRTYSCATRQNRGAVVCDCMATVNAAEAEHVILEVLGDLFSTPKITEGVATLMREMAAEARCQRTEDTDRMEALRGQLSEVEAQIARLVRAVAQGALVEGLLAEMRAAELRRDHLRHELQALEDVAATPAPVEILPTAVAGMVSELEDNLEEGDIEEAKALLSRLVPRIEVREDPRRGKKRPGAMLKLDGDVCALLRHVGISLGESGIVTSDNSPGGIRTRGLMAENHAS